MRLSPPDQRIAELPGDRPELRPGGSGIPSRVAPSRGDLPRRPGDRHRCSGAPQGRGHDGEVVRPPVSTALRELSSGTQLISSPTMSDSFRAARPSLRRPRQPAGAAARAARQASRPARQVRAGQVAAPVIVPGRRPAEPASSGRARPARRAAGRRRRALVSPVLDSPGGQFHSMPAASARCSASPQSGPCCRGPGRRHAWGARRACGSISLASSSGIATVSRTANGSSLRAQRPGRRPCDVRPRPAAPGVGRLGAASFRHGPHLTGRGQLAGLLSCSEARSADRLLWRGSPRGHASPGDSGCGRVGRERNPGWAGWRREGGDVGGQPTNSTSSSSAGAREPAPPPPAGRGRRCSPRSGDDDAPRPWPPRRPRARPCPP